MGCQSQLFRGNPGMGRLGPADMVLAGTGIFSVYNRQSGPESMAEQEVVQRDLR